LAIGALALLAACSAKTEIADDPPSTVPTADIGETGDDTDAAAPPETDEEERGNEIQPTATATVPTAVAPIATAEPTAEPTADPTPTPTVTQVASPPEVTGGELGNNTEPGVLNAPVTEWDEALEGNDDQVVALRSELLGIENPSQTQQLYLALADFRLGGPIAPPTVDAIKSLIDPATDRSGWSAEYTSLVDATALLAAGDDLFDLPSDFVLSGELPPFVHRFDMDFVELPDHLQIPASGLQLNPALDDGNTP